MWRWLTTPPVRLIAWLCGALQDQPDEAPRPQVALYCKCGKHNRYVVKCVGGKRDATRCPVCYGLL